MKILWHKLSILKSTDVLDKNVFAIKNKDPLFFGCFVFCINHIRFFNVAAIPMRCILSFVSNHIFTLITNMLAL